MFVSLGSTCSVAYHLQKLSKRYSAYPFDWIKTKELKDITLCIQNNFIDFLDFKEVSQSNKFPIFDPDIETFPDVIKCGSRIMENKYSMQFYHDFGEDSSLDGYVKEKYERRISRFFDLIRTSKQISFIRDEIHLNKIDSNQIEDFLRVIKSINSDLEIKLIIIIHNPKNKIIDLLNYKNENIVIVNDVFNYGGWQRPGVDWANLFI